MAWRSGLCKLVAPDFLFMDLDLGTLRNIGKLSKALTSTLSKIKEKLGGVPSVVWSGNGYHVYQPVDAFVCAVKAEADSVYIGGDIKLDTNRKR
jgi:hypothetical protein